MTSLEQTLHAELEQLQRDDLHRELRRIDSSQGPRLVVGGRSLLNFSSNDYLGLASHPSLKEAAARSISEYGAGSGASRLICGSLAPHHQLEEALAEFKSTEAALSFASGYAAAVGTISALLGKDDVIIVDKLVHASIVDAARLAGAKLRVFVHNDLNALEKILKWSDRLAGAADAGARKRSRRILIVTESVFSMDGDLAPLREIVELKEKHGAWLMLDEAHAAGLFGENRRGLAEAYGLGERVDIQMGTLGKALGSSGGYICGSRVLIDFLVNRARSFVFSTAPVPAASAAATAAVRLLQSAEGEARRVRLWQQVDLAKNLFIKSGWKLPPIQSGIIPLIVDSEERSLALSAGLREQGVLIPAIRYPTVARGKARLRVTLTASHSAEDLSMLEFAMRTVQPGQTSGQPA